VNGCDADSLVGIGCIEPFAIAAQTAAQLGMCMEFQGKVQ
jgi:hypothetical protein